MPDSGSGIGGFVILALAVALGVIIGSYGLKFVGGMTGTTGGQGY